MFLIDTNVLILASKHRHPDNQFFKEALEKGQLYISSITIAEFLSKATRPEKNFFELMISRTKILIVDETVARQAATYRKSFLKSSRTKLLDYLIAAQAKIYRLTLVTNNKSDFPMTDITIVKPA